MAYMHSVTKAAREEINQYVDRLLAQSAVCLDSQRTAEEIMGLLTDNATLSTPGFVLRRHIQASKLIRLEGCADLRKCGNIPWQERAVEQAASELSRLCYRRDGRRWTVSKENWVRYLTDSGTQGIQRKMIFRLAIAVGMDPRQTVELLLACGQAPYNVRDPLELTCWFYQSFPAVCRWSLVQEQIEEWKHFTSKSEKLGEDPASYNDTIEGETRQLERQVSHLLRDLEAGQDAREAGQKFLALLTENDSRLKGYSRTARSAYLHLADALAVLYGAGGGDDLTALISAMYQRQGWNFETLLQTMQDERYIFRGARADEGAAQWEECVFDQVLGKIAMFAKRYPVRAQNVRRGKAGVDRHDILFLSYFLITGYLEANEETAVQFEKYVKNRLDSLLEQKDHRFEAPLSGEAMLDQGVGEVLPYLGRLRRRPNAKQKFDLCRRVLNQLLSVFDFHAVYYPAAFDRFVLLSLLTDRPGWTTRYLFGDKV